MERQIRDADRERATQGRKSIGRHHIHELALQQDREKVVRQTKLRAAGFLPPIKVSIKDRIGKLVPDIPRENSQVKNFGADVFKKRKDERERRTCNHCGVREHIRINCPDIPKEEEPNKRQPENSTDLGTKSTKRALADAPLADRPVSARTAATEYAAGRGLGRGGGRGGGRAGRGTGRGVNPNNPHMTLDAQCAYCGKVNHTEAQCWSKNLHLRLGANMARLEEEGAAADRHWEANHQAHERRQQRLKQERDRREEAREEVTEEDNDNSRYQFMMQSGQRIASLDNMPIYTYGRRPTHEEEIDFQLAMMEGEIANGQRMAGDQPRQVPLQLDSPTSPDTDRELQWLLADST